MKYPILVGIVVSTFLFNSCGTYLNQPIDFNSARIGETTKVTKKLNQLPEPQKKVIVGVYSFRDLTGQYKPSEVGSTFSTAVTQGGTAILIEALENSGWFTPIERENIGNLLNERNIIRSTRQEYKGSEDEGPLVPPLLFAGVLLEGGIVSYDTNIITGGAGARYFGVGGSAKYRQDRVTVYLRVISTSTGEILKNVYISKTILSQALDANIFKYVKFQKLLEAEVGFTRNEPVQLAVTEAIEKAVESLIIEGLEDDLWNVKEGENAETLITAYNQEKEEAELTGLYDRKHIDREYKSSIGVSLGGSLISGDYSGEEFGPMVKVDYSAKLSESFFLNIAGSAFELSNGDSFSETYTNLDFNAGFMVLPNDKLSPYIFGGAGYVFNLGGDIPEGFDSSYFKTQYGIGLEYLISQKLSLKAFAEHNILFSDDLDYIDQGKRNDQYFNFGVGLNFNLGSNGNGKSNQNN